MTAQDLLYLTAEIDYRLDRAFAQFPRGRRHRVGRRRVLHLPQPRRRPLSVA